MIRLRAPLRRCAPVLYLVVLAFVLILRDPAPAMAGLRITDPWPEAEAIHDVTALSVTFLSSSPFVPTDVGQGPDDDPATNVLGRLFLPPGRHADRSLPAVILLHGASGVIEERELAYGRELAAMGAAALVVDSFGSRTDRGTGFLERLLNITETMVTVDAYAGLRYLASRREIDPQRIVLAGFSYGGMAAVFAAYELVAAKLAPDGLRFAGHVAYYAPCLAHFRDFRTTGAPILMLYGAADELIDAQRCAEIADELRRGGSRVEVVTYPAAVHQWDGPSPPTLVGYNLAACALSVEADGVVRDRWTGFTMGGTFTRKLIFVLCASRRPYPIGRNDEVHLRSNRDFGRFLTRVFAAGKGS